MPTSGLYAFQVTSDDISTAALRNLGVLRGLETPSPDQFTSLRFALNLILKTLPIETWLLWCYNWIPVPLVSGTASYTLGPTGTIVGVRPMRIADAYMRNTSITPATDIPMTQLARGDYDNLTPKDTPGIPVNYYYDPQLTNGALYVWPVINTSGYTMYVNNQRTIQDISATDGTQNFDLPQEWFLPLQWILSDEVGHQFSGNLEKLARIQQRAEGWLEKMANYSREEPGIYFTPNFQGQGY